MGPMHDYIINNNAFFFYDVEQPELEHEHTVFVQSPYASKNTKQKQIRNEINQFHLKVSHSDVVCTCMRRRRLWLFFATIGTGCAVA